MNNLKREFEKIRGNKYLCENDDDDYCYCEYLEKRVKVAEEAINKALDENEATKILKFRIEELTQKLKSSNSEYAKCELCGEKKANICHECAGEEMANIG